MNNLYIGPPLSPQVMCWSWMSAATCSSRTVQETLSAGKERTSQRPRWRELSAGCWTWKMSLSMEWKYQVRSVNTNYWIFVLIWDSTCPQYMSKESLHFDSELCKTTHKQHACILCVSKIRPCITFREMNGKLNIYITITILYWILSIVITAAVTWLTNLLCHEGNCNILKCH